MGPSEAEVSWTRVSAQALSPLSPPPFHIRLPGHSSAAPALQAAAHHAFQVLDVAAASNSFARRASRMRCMWHTEARQGLPPVSASRLATMASAWA